ncbi:MAG: glycosyltransferase 87 family protein [Gaiellaceae bacterium]
MAPLLLLIASGLLLATAIRVAAVLGFRSVPTLLLATYIVGYAELVVVVLGLSLVHQVAPVPLLVCLALIGAAVLVLGRRRATPVWPSLAWRTGLRDALGDRLVVVLAVAVLIGLAYIVALTVAVPQNEFDAIHDHLYRAALWKQNRAVGYPFCACAPYVNGYPPNGEIGVLFTMVLGRGDRFVGLPQTLAFVAIPVAIFGIARRAGLGRPDALFGGLVVATMPIVALQASTAMNDLVVASFLLAATVFILDESELSPWIAGLATALAVGTKVYAPLGVPLLLAAAIWGAPAERRRTRVVAIVAGSVVGCYWYVANLVHTGTWSAGFVGYLPVDHGVAATVSRFMRFGIEFVDLSGAVGHDRWLYAIVAVGFGAGLLAWSLLARTRQDSLFANAAIVVTVGLIPVGLLPFARLLGRVYTKAWDVVGRHDLAVLDPGRDITRAASNYSWYGPLGSFLLVGAAAVVVWYVARRRRGDCLGVLFVLAPLYWLIVFSGFLFYQQYAGRFFIFPIALASSALATVLRTRTLAWGVTLVAVTTLGLTLLNDEKRPAGIRLLEPHHRASIWTASRSAALSTDIHVSSLIRYIDTKLPANATVGLDVTPSDPPYIFFGPRLRRRLRFIGSATRDVPGAQWVFASPGLTPALCKSSWQAVAAKPSGWKVYRRITATVCDQRT